MDLEKTYFSKKAGSFSGVPQRTVQAWTEKGLLDLPTSGTGDRRKYSVLNCIEIGLIKSLSDARVSQNFIRGVMSWFRVLQPPSRIQGYLKYRFALLVISINNETNRCDVRKVFIFDDWAEFLDKDSEEAHKWLDDWFNMTVPQQSPNTVASINSETGASSRDAEQVLIFDLNKIARRVLKAIEEHG